MQKKKTNIQESSAWEDTLKKEQRKDNVKKYAIWAVFGLIFLAGLGVLVKMADTPGPGATPIEVSNLPGVTDKDIIIGDKNAKVALIEYSDFQCPACASYNPLVNRLLEEYKGKIKFVYRYFPLTGVHKNALISAQAAYAANKQAKFSEMKDLLFENQPSWENLENPRETFSGYAKSIGLNVDQFKRDIDSDEARSVVSAGEKEAISLGLNSTPTFFIGNKKVSPQGYDQFKSLIDEALK